MFRTTLRSLALASAVTAAAVLGPEAQAQKSADTLRIASEEALSTLDYYKGAERTNIIMSHHLFDTLIYKDADSGEIVPALAESYEFLDDDTIRFVIREGVKFHNGEVMTVDDVVYTLNMVADPDYGALYQIAVQWIDRAEKVDDRTVDLHMKEPYPVALEWLAGFLPIYPQEYYERVGPAGMAVEPVGTGPYRLVSVDPGSHWVLERFDDHYEGSPKGNAIGRIDLRMMPEINTQLTEFMTGGLDFIWKFTPDLAQRLEGRPNVNLHNVPILRIVYMLVNLQEDSPLQDVRVRQAMMHAMNREEIMLTFVGAGSEVIHSPCNPVQFGCKTDVTTYDYDLDRARELMAEAGYPDGFELDMLVSIQATTSRTIQEALMANLSQIGIELSVNQQHWAAAREAWIGGSYPLILMSWGSWGMAMSP